MPLRIGIIADDFTSAMDGAGPFVAHRAADRATVVVDGHAAPPGTELLSIDIDSRGRPADEAADLARAASLRVRDAPLLYKTVDSTLRGHLALEIEAAWEASGRRRVIFAPAFPAAGRTTRGGVQYLDGVDLGESSFASDARQAVATGDIERLLGSLPSRLPGGTLHICDAENDGDLDAIVAAHDDAEILWVGSPGLAHALARKHRQADAPPQPSIAPIQRVAVIIGSMHALNRTQLQRLQEHGAPVGVVTAPPASGPITPASAKAVGNDLAWQARALLAAGYEGLIVTGGETVRAVVAGLDEPAVQVLDEPAPGIVRGRLAGGAMLVTKAGGFGDADTLIGLYKHLTEGGAA
jgi:uncharacterized protein YgbK (DUF1537 family)